MNGTSDIPNPWNLMQRVEVILLKQVPRDVKKFCVVIPVLCGRGEQATRLGQVGIEHELTYVRAGVLLKLDSFACGSQFEVLLCLFVVTLKITFRQF